MPTLMRMRKYVLVFLVCTLSATVLLKVGEIQYLELVLAADFFLLVCLFAQNRFQVRIFRPYFSLAESYAIFLSLAFLLSVIALRQNFFEFNDTLFKKPLIVTISRMAELFLDVFYMLYLASLYREDEKICRFAARTYFWTGIVGGIYALVTYPLSVMYDLELGTSLSHRLRGFNNEGGSYGTYLISVCLLAIAMYRRKWLSRGKFYCGMALLIVCMIGSQSKAAFLAVALLGMLLLMMGLKGWKRLTLSVATCVFVVILASFINLASQINVYVKASASYQTYSKLRSEDGNYVMGRVSGAVLAPRMIEAHPFLGIGWGNYPLVRDDPQYRRGTAFSLASIDSPSLGPIDYIVELGFPLWVYMTWIAIKPVYLLRRHGSNIWLIGLAMMQPLSNWFGAHLNLTYPWVVVGLALGMGFLKKDQTPGETALVSAGIKI